MKKISCFVAFVAIATCSIMAQTADQKGARTVIDSFLRASQHQDAQAYASLFADASVWDGPQGQHANIRNAVQLMFSNSGPLQPVFYQAKPLAPDALQVDVYQKIKYAADGFRKVPVATGSGVAPMRSNVRTTMILKKGHEGWKIVSAAAADLRVRPRE
jgi:uncharacterized protein (TIGR02246 family)